MNCSPQTKREQACYFYRTVGIVNASTVERYVAESQEYGYAGSELAKQRKLIEFFTPN